MSTPAGWYDDGSGRARWWDGTQWTDAYADEQGGSGVAAAATSAAGSVMSTHDPASEPGTLWSAVGKPLTGIGAGRYRVTEEYLIFEKGTLSTKSQQIRVHEIFDVDASQSMSQKARGVGTITLWARRPGGDERISLEDIPNFREGVATINRVADEARHRLLTRQNTQHVNYSGGFAGAPVTHAPAAAAGVSSGGDLNNELARLAQFHQQGVLSDEEFAAGKRKLLGL